jgi:uncharacterized NAD(P)/FAD-binding protein YdhS
VAPQPEVVAIVGGGASGVLSAMHLLRAGPAPIQIVIVEPRAELGRGPAYGTTDLEHLLNVRAENLSALPDVPDDFTQWAQQRTTADAHSFLPRAWYGEYLRSQLPSVEHVRARAVDVAPWSGRVQVSLADGTSRRVDRVILSLGSSPPVWPKRLGGTGSRWVGDPWSPDLLTDLCPANPVLLVGTGLTAVDVALSLHAAGHRQIFATSRHGLLPGAHADGPLGPVRVIPPSQPTARSLLTWARATAAEVGDWRPVIDALRPHTNELWGALAESERVRLLHHVHRRWEVLRHRMAPRVASRIETMREAGHLTVLPGGIRSARTTPHFIEVSLADCCLRVGTVINCAGSPADVRRSVDPLVRRLLDHRVAYSSPLHLGISTDARGCLHNTGDALWLVGPLRRGRTWETTAIPEIREQAASLPEALWRVNAMAGS